METAITYSLRLTARALAPLASEKSVSKWMVGTNSLREENEVRALHVPTPPRPPRLQQIWMGPSMDPFHQHTSCRVSDDLCKGSMYRFALLALQVRILQYDPDQERLISCKSYIHRPEIWDIAPCPASQDSFLTVWAKGEGAYCSQTWVTALR